MQENYEEIVSRFEVLVAIRYDNRPLFISTVSQEMAKALGWIGSFTVPVGTSSGIVERMNCTLKETLTKLRSCQGMNRSSSHISPSLFCSYLCFVTPYDIFLGQKPHFVPGSERIAWEHWMTMLSPTGFDSLTFVCQYLLWGRVQH